MNNVHPYNSFENTVNPSTKELDSIQTVSIGNKHQETQTTVTEMLRSFNMDSPVMANDGLPHRLDV